MRFKCPETIEELEKLERLLPLCRKALYEAAQAKLESGAARTRREAERQLAEETGRPEATIRTAIRRESQINKVDSLNPPCNIDSQAGPAKKSHDEERMSLKDWFCPECGEIFPAPVQLCHCLRCGAHYPPEDEYCSNCHESLAGMPLTDETTDEDDKGEYEECETVAPASPKPICSIWTGDQESYTPAQYIEAAREVMGSIDLDPASNHYAQQIVKATRYYTKDDDGLSQPWQGNIFLNPPYSHPEVKLFVDKLLQELKPGQQAILLTNNNTDTTFFHDAARRASALCFTKGRIRFLKPDGSYSNPTNGQVFYYFGDQTERFKEVFGRFRRFTPIAYDGHFDWDFLLEAFKGTNITPTDIDCLVERNCKFLIIETKSPGKKVPKGQVLALERLLKLGKGQLVVFVLWGKVPNQIRAMEEWHCVSGDITKIRWDGIDAQFVLSRVVAWRQWAEK